MSIKDTLKRSYNKLRGFFPERTPSGVTEFNAWSESLINTYNPPGDERSIKFVLSSMLMRLDASEAYVSKFYFYRALCRSAAAQVAVFIQEGIKQQQREEFENQQAEATALLQEASNDQQQETPNGAI